MSGRPGAGPGGRTPERLERAINTSRILIFALASSALMFVVIGTIVAQQLSSEGDVATYRVPLVALAFCALIASVMYRRFSLATLRLEQIYTAKGVAGFVDHLFRSTLISAALGEAVGVFGFLLGVLTGETDKMYALCAASLAAILFSLPKANGWRDLYQQVSARAPVGSAG